MWAFNLEERKSWFIKLVIHFDNSEFMNSKIWLNTRVTPVYLGRSWKRILLTAKSRSARGASRHPAFMDSSLTVSQTRLPRPPCGKMGLQSWTVVVAINKLWNLDFERSWLLGGYVVELPPMKPQLDTAEMPKLFCLTATEIACTNDGGDHEVMYRSRQLFLVEWEGWRM